MHLVCDFILLLFLPADSKNVEKKNSTQYKSVIELEAIELSTGENAANFTLNNVFR